MSQDPCGEFQTQLTDALHELERIRSDPQATPSTTTPAKPNDVGRTYFQSIGRLEAAKRSYRAALRALTECQAENLS